MKERCAPSSRRMLPSVLYGPAETVAMAVFRRQVLRVDPSGGWGLVTVVKAGTLLLAVEVWGGSCVVLATGEGGGLMVGTTTGAGGHKLV